MISTTTTICEEASSRKWKASSSKSSSFALCFLSMHVMWVTTNWEEVLMRNSSLTQEENTKSGQTKRYTHENTKTQTFSLSSKDVLYTVVVCFKVRRWDEVLFSDSWETLLRSTWFFTSTRRAHLRPRFRSGSTPWSVFSVWEKKRSKLPPLNPI